MLIAKIENGAVAKVADYRALFPNTSFPPNGPSADFLADSGCLPVTVFKPHDRNTQKLVSVAPYVEAGVVYTVAVEGKTQADLNADDDAKRAANEARAKQELETSDWAELPTVRDTSKTPHLVNAAAFDAYRVELRAIVVNPPVDVAQWPARPDAVWSS